MDNLTGKKYSTISQLFNEKYQEYGYSSEASLTSMGNAMIYFYKNNKKIAAFNSRAVRNYRIERWIKETIDDPINEAKIKAENRILNGDTTLTDELKLSLSKINELELSMSKAHSLIDISREQSPRELADLKIYHEKLKSLSLMINKFDPKLYS